MTERDKLQNHLQAYYNAQVYEPPTATWQEIAAQQGLVPKKKKRRALLWLVFAALFMGGLGYVYLADVSVNNKDVIAHSKKKQAQELQNLTTPAQQHETKESMTVPDVAKSSNIVVHAPIQHEKQANYKSLLMATNSTVPSHPVEDKISSHNSSQEQQSTNKVGSVLSDLPSNPALPLASINSNTSVGQFLHGNDGADSETKLQAPAVKLMQNDNSETIAANNTKIDTTSNTQLQSTTGVQSDSGLVTETLNLIDTTRATNPSLAELAANTEVPDSILKLKGYELPFKEGLHVDVGTYWSYGYAAGSKRDARGFSATAGAYYSTEISSRFWLSAGLRYLEVRNLSYSSKTSRTSTFTYGENSTITTITPFSLHYLSIPVSCAFVLSAKQQIGMTAAFNYLLNVTAKIKELEQQQGSANKTIEYKQSGYVQGISWLDMQAALFYRYRFNTTFAAQLEIIKGITDVKENNFFSLQQSERNNGFRISMVYYLPETRKNNVH